jgi:hypothetical protein
MGAEEVRMPQLGAHLDRMLAIRHAHLVRGQAQLMQQHVRILYGENGARGTGIGHGNRASEHTAHGGRDRAR